MAMSMETKAGAFFLIAFVILALITFKVEDVAKLFRPTYVLKARFKHASGLKVGDPVAVAGVTVGTVRELRLDEDGIVVVAQVKGDVRVRKDAMASIAWLGVLGTKYVDISLGSRDQPLLERGSEILKTRDAIELGGVMEKVDLAANELRQMLSSELKGDFGTIIRNLAEISEDVSQQKGTLGKLLGSDEMYGKLDAIATNLTGASGSLKKIIADNEKDLDALIKNLSAASPEIKNAFQSVQGVVQKVESGKGVLAALLNDEKLSDELKATVSGIRSFADKLAQGKGLAQRLVSDEKMAEDAGAGVADFRKVAADVRSAVADIQAFVKKASEGQGTIQLLLTDRGLYDDAKSLMADAKETLRGMKEQIPVGTFTGLLVSTF